MGNTIPGRIRLSRLRGDPGICIRVCRSRHNPNGLRPECTKPHNRSQSIRIAMRFPNNKGFYQNPGQSTIGAQIGAISMQSSRQSRSRSTPHPRSRRNRPENYLDQHSQNGLQMDCKITKDCKEINRITSTSWKIHNPTTVRGDCEAIQEPQQIVSIRTQFGRITRKSTINANSDCNRRQIGF